MAEFITPTKEKCKSKITDAKLLTPIRIPASPFLEPIGYGTGVGVYMLERSPKIGCTRSPWAIKKFLRGKSNETTHQRLKVEADILRQLNHPNIIGFRAFASGIDGTPCLAIEALDMSLDSRIEQRQECTIDEPFPPKDILRVGFEIAKGLKYLHHEMNILHGDIKSGNILVSHNFSTVKLCDFGHSLSLTKSLELDTSGTRGNRHYIGTQCWNAPEIIHENGPVTNAADIWAYGLVLWEMIALMPPHVGDLESESFDESKDEEENMTDSQLGTSGCDMDESVTFLEDIMPNICGKYGTRPALPAIDLSSEYSNILEVFYICTTADYKLRPSAKILVNYFEKREDNNV